MGIGSFISIFIVLYCILVVLIILYHQHRAKCPVLFVLALKRQSKKNSAVFGGVINYLQNIDIKGVSSYFIASSTATAQATVAPTIGLLPMPIRPIIST